MIPNWKQLLAALVVISAAFGLVLGCELLSKKAERRGLVPRGAEPVSAEAQAKTLLSRGLREMFTGQYGESEKAFKDALVLQPESAFLHFKLAEACALQNKYDDAVKSAGEAIQLDPEWTEPYNFLIQIFLFTNRAQDAQALARKLTEMRPDDPTAVIQLSRTYQAQGLAGPSILVLEEFNESYPRQSETRAELARLLVRLGRLDEAEAAYQDLLGLSPGDEESWAEYAQLLAARNKPDAAQNAYQQYLKIVPFDVNTRIELVKLLSGLGRKQEARREIETAKAYALDSEQVYEFSAFLYLQDNRIDLAKKEYLGLLSQNPESESAIYSLGLIEAEQKNWAEAQAWFSRIPESSKLYLDARSQVIQAFYYQGKKDEAFDMARRLVGGHAGDAGTWLTLAGLYQKEEKYDEAISTLNDGLKRIPDDPQIFYSLAMVYSLTGNIDKSLELAQAALLKKPEDPALLNFIGYTWADQGKNLDQAQEYIKRALAKDPDNGAIIDSLAWVNFRKGRTRESLKLLEKAVKIIPDDPELLKHLGQVWLKLGDKKKASSWLRKALQQKPRLALKKEIEDLIKQAE